MRLAESQHHLAAVLALDSLAATADFGRQLAAILRGGDVLALTGDLGAGKTTLVQAIGAAWHVEDGVIRSPTFSLVNVVELAASLPAPNVEDAMLIKNRADLDLVHADLYRLTDSNEVISCGLAELLGQPDCICIVEWPALAESVFPPGLLRLSLQFEPATGRRTAAMNTVLRDRLQLPR